MARMADFQSADGSSILLAGTISRSSNGSGQNATNVQIRVRVPSGIPKFTEWWPSGKGTSLSMRTRWVRLPSTSPSIDAVTYRGVAKSGLKRSALTREIESSNLSSPANLIMCYIDFVNRALSLSSLRRRYWSSRLSSYCSL